MEATCQYVESEKNAPVGDATWESDGAISWVCGAPIPRLEEDGVTPCVGCGHAEGHVEEWGCLFLLNTATHAMERWCNCRTYVGPLAATCAQGHPVAVPAEAERMG